MFHFTEWLLLLQLNSRGRHGPLNVWHPSFALSCCIIVFYKRNHKFVLFNFIVSHHTRELSLSLWFRANVGLTGNLDLRSSADSARSGLDAQQKLCVRRSCRGFVLKRSVPASAWRSWADSPTVGLTTVQRCHFSHNAELMKAHMVTCQSPSSYRF